MCVFIVYCQYFCLFSGFVFFFFFYCQFLKFLLALIQKIAYFCFFFFFWFQKIWVEGCFLSLKTSSKDTWLFISNSFSNIQSVGITHGWPFLNSRLGHMSVLSDVVQTWCSPACPHITQCAGSDIWDLGKLTAPKMNLPGEVAQFSFSMVRKEGWNVVCNLKTVTHKLSSQAIRSEFSQV